MVVDDGVDRRADRQFDVELAREVHQGLHRVDALGKLCKRLARDKIFAKAAIVAVRREERRLIVTEMREAIDRHAVAAHRLDEARELVRAAGHQRTLEAAVAEAVEHTRGQADDVLRGRADLRAQQVLSVVEADQGARECVDELARELHLARRDDHAVRDAAH